MKSLSVGHASGIILFVTNHFNIRLRRETPAVFAAATNGADAVDSLLSSLSFESVGARLFCRAGAARA